MHTHNHKTQRFVVYAVNKSVVVRHIVVMPKCIPPPAFFDVAASPDELWVRASPPGRPSCRSSLRQGRLQRLVPACGGQLGGGAAFPVSAAWVCSPLQQAHRHGSPAWCPGCVGGGGAAGEVEGCASVAVSGIHRRAPVEEQLAEGHLAGGGGHVQERAPRLGGDAAQGPVWGEG